MTSNKDVLNVGDHLYYKDKLSQHCIFTIQVHSSRDSDPRPKSADLESIIEVQEKGQV